MPTLMVTGFSGWLLMLLLAVTIVLPFAMSRTRIAEPCVEGRGSNPAFKYHYGLGYAIAFISFAHAWIPMSAGWGGRLNTAGLYAATIAWLLVYLQVAIGRRLRGPGRPRGYALRWHFWVMVILVTFVLVHVILNSFVGQMFLFQK